MSGRVDGANPLEEYERLSSEIQDLCEQIISAGDPEAEWVGEVKRSYRGFLEGDAEILKALSDEVGQDPADGEISGGESLRQSRDEKGGR